MDDYRPICLATLGRKSTDSTDTPPILDLYSTCSWSIFDRQSAVISTDMSTDTLPIVDQHSTDMSVDIPNKTHDPFHVGINLYTKNRFTRFSCLFFVSFLEIKECIWLSLHCHHCQGAELSTYTVKQKDVIYFDLYHKDSRCCYVFMKFIVNKFTRVWTKHVWDFLSKSCWRQWWRAILRANSIVYTSWNNPETCQQQQQ